MRPPVDIFSIFLKVVEKAIVRAEIECTAQHGCIWSPFRPFRRRGWCWTQNGIGHKIKGKMKENKPIYTALVASSKPKKELGKNQPTDRLTDRPTNGRTEPLIELLRRNLK